eukprot:TRINITY_DN9182_c0_g3_i1.p1 TRINITY_DN9182_c0_g3~~TRINITY_DN9182_c0_g3_i1.p1  ORF type:complete len:247 (-),score=51.32 TRINITY_DN9182_c0_g3_i1:405-1145(-)
MSAIPMWTSQSQAQGQAQIWQTSITTAGPIATQVGQSQMQLQVQPAQKRQHAFDRRISAPQAPVSFAFEEIGTASAREGQHVVIDRAAGHMRAPSGEMLTPEEELELEALRIEVPRLRREALLQAEERENLPALVKKMQGHRNDAQAEKARLEEELVELDFEEAQQRTKPRRASTAVAQQFLASMLQTSNSTTACSVGEAAAVKVSAGVSQQAIRAAAAAERALQADLMRMATAGRGNVPSSQRQR